MFHADFGGTRQRVFAKKIRGETLSKKICTIKLENYVNKNVKQKNNEMDIFDRFYVLQGCDCPKGVIEAKIFLYSVVSVTYLLRMSVFTTTLVKIVKGLLWYLRTKR